MAHSSLITPPLAAAHSSLIALPLVFPAKLPHTVFMSGMYKDSLFRSLFSNKEAFLSLYNAVSGSSYGDDTEVVINTLSDTLFTSKKNDVSGIFDRKFVAFTEQQASINENMPFRFLSPIARLFENSISDRNAVYRQSLVKLPRPEFIVLYNGSAGYPDKTTLRLSDAFEQVEGNAAVNLELKVEVYNIGKGHNEAIVRKSLPLSGYVDFVHIAEESRTRIKLENPGINRELVLEKAVAYTVTYCKRHGILKDFLENLSPEEENMLATEWNMEDALRVREEEGEQRGRKEGERSGEQRKAAEILKLFDAGYSMDEVRERLKAGGTLQ
ncbi:MAG: hypothetical protein LBK66_10125 [Spirochaetaceae bacterium]|nr:hypothetical protein [Spirochaetaceae bacterium]